MNNKNWYKLNLDISNAIRSDFDFENFLAGAEYVAKNQSGVWGFGGDNLTNMFTDTWLEYMKSINLEVSAVLIFYRMPHFTHSEAHIDYLYGRNDTSNIAINWVINEDDSSMAWYHTPDDVATRIRKFTPGGGHEYISWPMTEVAEIERHTIGHTPTLVRIDIPHNIIVNNNPRWSVSVRLAGNDREWEKIVDKFAPFIKQD